jgi:hypothetical protein
MIKILAAILITSVVWALKPTPAPVTEFVPSGVALPNGQYVIPELVRLIVVERFQMQEQLEQQLLDPHFILVNPCGQIKTAWGKAECIKNIPTPRIRNVYP